MNIVRVSWAVSALVWGGIIVIMCAALGWWAIAITAFFAVFPDVSLIGAFAGEGRLKPSSVSFYNALHSLKYPIVLIIVGLIVFLASGTTDGGIWHILIAGIAWFVHIAVDRACGFGFRDSEGRIIPVG